jgi:hypothetical protein
VKTSRRPWVAIAAVVAALALGACQGDADSTAHDPVTPSPSAMATPSPTATPSEIGDPWQALTIPAAAYGEWRPALTDVRPWSVEATALLAARVDDASAREWTTTFVLRDELPLELAHEPGHDRVRLYADDGGWAFEVHVDSGTPFGPGEPVPMVVCQHGQYGPECMRVRGDESPDELTSLLGDYSDAYAPLLRSLAASQSARHPLVVRPSDPDRVFLARVDSPDGPLDCAVQWPTEASEGDLEGQPLAIGSGSPDGYPAWCVDQRGLVLVSSGDETSLMALTAMAPRVDGDIAHYPAEISSRVP